MLFLQIFPLKFFPTHQTPPTLFSELASDKGGTDKIAIFQAVGLAIKFAILTYDGAITENVQGANHISPTNLFIKTINQQASTLALPLAVATGCL